MSESKDLEYYMNLPYRVLFIPEEDGSAFTAIIPKLDGCIAFGETIEEAYQMLIEAKRLWLETVLERGLSIPEPDSEEPKEYSGRFNVRLPRFLHRDLAELAAAQDTSLNQLVVTFLAEGVERRRHTHPKRDKEIKPFRPEEFRALTREVLQPPQPKRIEPWKWPTFSHIELRA